MNEQRAGESRRSWLLFAATALGAGLAGAGIVLALYVGSGGGLQPGWFQALANSLAVFVAIGLPIAQNRRDRAKAERQKTEARADLARALHVELADRVARCCFDFEKPWSAWLDRSATRSDVMDTLRLQKFAPTSPVIYPQVAAQIASLHGDIPRRIIEFYFRLSAWDRDVKAIIEESRGNPLSGVPSISVHYLAHRLGQTLMPGLHALEALGALVANSEEIENAILASYSTFVPKRAREDPSLRKRLRSVSAS